LVNFSSEDVDSRVIGCLLEPSLDLLREVNFAFSQEFCDDIVLTNVVWFLTNLIGEKNPEITSMILKRTDILDFMLMVTSKYQALTAPLMKLLPWLCSNIMGQ
jgi:hypothetical protein